MWLLLLCQEFLFESSKFDVSSSVNSIVILRRQFGVSVKSSMRINVQLYTLAKSSYTEVTSLCDLSSPENCILCAENRC